MGKHLVVNGPGFPGTNKTLRFINDAINGPMSALAQLCGDRVIISGMNIFTRPPSTQQYYEPGFISINNDIVYFEGGEVLPYIKIETVTEQDAYKTSNGLVPMDAYRTVTAKCVASPGAYTFLASELVRLTSLRTIAQGVPFSQSLLAKLNGIATGAEVNVQADWNVANEGSDAFIRNKPANLLSRHIQTYSYIFTGQGLVYTINHNLGTDNYLVIYEVENLVQNVDDAMNDLKYYTATTIARNSASLKFAARQIAGSSNAQVKLRIYLIY